ncbi:MAG TPA: methyltransferase domain-containing protein [Candidatus Krumholzibacteriaceae bacterium]|nr:methyltransferase domain-containing protein [Candidatus Krumholzibacteriaceae bacterium]
MPNLWKQKRSTIRHYDQTAETYDQQYMEEQNIKIATALKALTQPVGKNAVILDAGCGTGTFFPHIARKTKQTIGIDTSLKLLKKAKIKAHPNVALIRADADFLPFKADIFTHVFAFTLIQNTPNPQGTMEEFKRVTHRNAILVVTGLKKHFTQTAFIKLLENVRLVILILKADEGLKDFVAVCRKHL